MSTKEQEEIISDEATRRDPLRRRAVRRLWRAQTVYITALVIFAILAVLAHLYAYFSWDVAASTSVQALPPREFWQRFMRVASLAGDKWIPWTLTTVAALLFLFFNKRSEAAGIVLSAGGSALLNSILKKVIARPRPTSELVMVFRPLDTQSFPSGHVTFYVCFFGFLFFTAYALLPRGSVARRAALILTALPILLIGLSRVYLGAHWPSDTIGAYFSSGLWLAFSLDMYRRWKGQATFKT